VIEIVKSGLHPKSGHDRKGVSSKRCHILLKGSETKENRYEETGLRLRIYVKSGESSHERREAPPQVCREHNMSNSVLDHWRKEYEQLGEAAFTKTEVTEQVALERKIAELERFCGQLVWENAVLIRACRFLR
jgi:Transposase